MTSNEKAPEAKVQSNESTEKDDWAEVSKSVLEALPNLVPLLAKVHSERTDAIREYNQVQGRLWGRAMHLEAVLVGTVLACGFGASAVLAYVGQIQSAEKIAFALFGFIGGRGFLHIRGLVESAKKG